MWLLVYRAHTRWSSKSNSTIVTKHFIQRSCTTFFFFQRYCKESYLKHEPQVPHPQVPIPIGVKSYFMHYKELFEVILYRVLHVLWFIITLHRQKWTRCTTNFRIRCVDCCWKVQIVYPLSAKRIHVRGNSWMANSEVNSTGVNLLVNGWITLGVHYINSSGFQTSFNWIVVIATEHVIAAIFKGKWFFSLEAFSEFQHVVSSTWNFRDCNHFMPSSWLICSFSITKIRSRQ